VVLCRPEGRATAAALLVDGRVEDLMLDPRTGDTRPRVGGIYRARVVRAAPKTGGAFVELTRDENGFLRDAKDVREGERLWVQVTGLPEPGKAVPVSTRILHKGRTVIHTPGAPGINVSRQIRDPEERERLQEIVEAEVARVLGDAEGDDALREAVAGGGFILRSAAEGVAEEELLDDLHLVVSERLSIESGDDGDGPGPFGAVSAVEAALRDWCHPLPDAIVAEGDRREVAELGLPPSLDALLRPFEGDPFDHFGVWDEIEALAGPRVALPSGGTMLVEPTSALVAVDVNTGGDFSPAAGLKANLEAARELPRQLRLRGLGGQVVVDFAPMPKKDRRRLEDALKTSLRRDPVETTVHGWTVMGLYELQRKRERRALSELL
jgi:Rne/Rng family ribonuclease